MDVPKPKTIQGDFKNCKNSSLFDISRNMETTKGKGGNVVEGLTGNEKLSYEDWQGESPHLLSQEIDTEYKAEQLKIQQAEVELETSYHKELNYISEELEEMPSSSKRKSHTEDQVFKVDKNVQVNIKLPLSPTGLVRNATYEILDAIAGVSTASGILVAKARAATREVCKQKYGDIYELELPKQSGEPSRRRKSLELQKITNSMLFYHQKSRLTISNIRRCLLKRSLLPKLCSPRKKPQKWHYITTEQAKAVLTVTGLRWYLILRTKVLLNAEWYLYVPCSLHMKTENK